MNPEPCEWVRSDVRGELLSEATRAVSETCPTGHIECRNANESTREATHRAELARRENLLGRAKRENLLTLDKVFLLERSERDFSLR